MSPALSIVTTCRDHCTGLARTHETLRRQGWRDFEWIVQDGGSTDGSAEFAKGCRSPRANVASAPDDGPYDGMNRGAGRATGRYVLFLNAGDGLASADTLERLAPFLDSRADVIYGDSIEAAAGSWRLKKARPAGRLWYGMPTHHQAIIFRRRSLGSRPYEHERYRIAADYDLLLRLHRDGREIVRVPFPICRFEPGGISARQARRGREEQRAIRRRVLGMSRADNLSVSLLQLAAAGFRGMLPRLYSCFRHAGAPLQANLPIIEGAAKGEIETRATVEDAQLP